MNRLKTDYVNAELNTSINEHTVYKETVVSEANKTKTFEDVSVYSVTGDTFGAEDMNATNTEINLLETVDFATLSASGWSAVIPYSQTIQIPRIKETDNPIVDLYYPENETSENYKLAKKAYSCIDRAFCVDGGITFQCWNKKPQTNIRIKVKGV